MQKSNRALCKSLLVEHGERLNGPHEELVPGELSSEAGQPGHLARLVALELLVEDLRRAEPARKKAGSPL